MKPPPGRHTCARHRAISLHGMLLQTILYIIMIKKRYLTAV